jgi:hypothetical protein
MRGRWMLPALGVALAVGPVRAETVVKEHSEHYQLGVDYDVANESYITIHNYDEGFEYDFEAYNSETFLPDAIRSIAADQNVGDIVLMVRGHEGRDVGATRVDYLDLTQPGNTGTIPEFNISGVLGTDGVTRLTWVTGYFHADNVANDAELAGLPAGGHIELREFGAHTLHVAGSVAGMIELGHG